jgi:hypothetical protein
LNEKKKIYEIKDVENELEEMTENEDEIKY